MPPSVERRLVILAEGNFGFHHGKTAMGVIRFGHDKVVAVIDSTQAGHNVREWLGDSGRNDIPIVGTLNDALGVPAPGQRAADRHRAHRRQAARRLAGRDPRRDPVRPRRAVRASTRSWATTRSSPRPPAPSGVRLIDFRRPPERMETAVGRRHVPGKRVLLTVGTDCAIGKMSVALELRRAAQAAGRSAAFVATGQTGMMIEGWGVAVDRLIADFLQGTVEWLVEDGRVARRLGDRRGPGLARPPGVQQRDARPDPRMRRRTPWSWSTSPGMADHDFDHLPEARFPIAPLRAVHRDPRGGGRPRRAVEGRRRRAQHLADRRRRRGAPDHRGDGGRDRAAVRRPGPFRRGGAVGGIEAGVDALPWVGLRAGRCRPGRRRHAAGARERDLRRRRCATLVLPLRDPFVIARASHGEGRASTTVRRRAPRRRGRPRRPGRPRRGLSGRVLRRDAETMAAVVPAAARGDRARRGRTPGRPRRGAGRPRRRGGQDGRGHRPPRRGEVRDRHRAPRPRRQAAGPAHPRPARHRRAPSRRPTSRWASTSPRSSPSGRAGPSDFPALKVKVGGPDGPRDGRARCAPCSTGPIRVDANTGWSPEEAVALLPELQRLGVELIEQPFPARRLDDLRDAPGPVAAAARRRRERRDDRRPRRRSSASSPAST